MHRLAHTLVLSDLDRNITENNNNTEMTMNFVVFKMQLRMFHFSFFVLFNYDFLQFED